jgi:hypothetical protein
VIVRAILTRAHQNNVQTVGYFVWGTFGKSTVVDFVCYTIEPPWKDNQKFVSRIPSGTYKVKKHVSPTFGKCFLVCGVKGRDHILIHAGNFHNNTKGCILVGDWLTDINQDGCVDIGGPDSKNGKLGSRGTLKKLLGILPDEFELEVKNAQSIEAIL